MRRNSGIRTLLILSASRDHGDTDRLSRYALTEPQPDFSFISSKNRRRDCDQRRSLRPYTTHRRHLDKRPSYEPKYF